MEFSSPALPRPRSDFVPASPGVNVKKSAIYISDSDGETDELATHIPESSPYFTQPTQVVNRTTLQPTSARLTSSSPKTEVEVPVSSPIRPQKASMAAGGRLASLMAPAGTVFRQPHVHQKPNPPKRKYQDSDDELEEAVYVGDSSDDDGRPARGDIRPSSFKPRQTTPPTPRCQSDKQILVVRTAQPKLVSNRLQQLAKKLRSAVGHAYSLEDCARALEKHGNNVTDASTALRSGSITTNGKTQSTILSAFARVGPDAARNSSTSTSPTSSQDSSRSVSSSRTSQGPATPSPQPIKTRGRLQRGLKPRTPGSSQLEVAMQPVRRTELIDLVSEDELLDNDDFSSEPEPVSSTTGVDLDSTGEHRILEYLEKCTVENLMAITKMRAAENDRAMAMIQRRPYQSLNEARAVTIKGSGKAKRNKIAVGEAIVEKLIQFVETLDAIEHVVELCETKGKKINSTLNRWKIARSGGEKSSEGDSKCDLVELPYPCEPKAMQGKCTLQPYQLFGMNWLWQLYSQQFGCILADDMGLGKTCQVVAFVSLLVQNYKAGVVRGDKPWPVLIVVPPSTLANWQAEFNKFSSGLELITYSGTQTERDAIAYDIREDPKAYHVVLTSYSQLSRPEDIKAMRRIRPHVAVFDEAHKLKTPTSRIYQQLIRIDADWKLFLTGTPVQNNIMEMVALLNFINPDLFRDHMDALEDLFQHRASLQEVSQGAVLQSDRVTRARTILEPFILQRKKEDVLTTLPEKTRRVVYCDLLDNQKSVYREYEGNYRREVRRAIGRLNGRSDDQNNPWMQLRKAAIHGQLFRRFFTDEKVAAMAKVLMRKVPQERLGQPDLDKLVMELKGESDFRLHLWCRDEPCVASYDVPESSWMESGKVQKLLELVREFQKNGDRVLVFSKFVMVLEILQECFASAGVDYRILKGDTKVSERQEIIDEFNEDDSIPVFLLTTGAGGTGINLTSANKVIIFDQSDNPQDDIQAENRAHRFGQTREVEVIRMLTKGTIEELVHKACQRKLELAGQITGYGEDISAKMIEAEVRQMLVEEEKGGDSS